MEKIIKFPVKNVAGGTKDDDGRVKQLSQMTPASEAEHLLTLHLDNFVVIEQVIYSNDGVDWVLLAIDGGKKMHYVFTTPEVCDVLFLKMTVLELDSGGVMVV